MLHSVFHIPEKNFFFSVPDVFLFEDSVVGEMGGEAFQDFNFTGVFAVRNVTVEGAVEERAFYGVRLENILSSILMFFYQASAII